MVFLWRQDLDAGEIGGLLSWTLPEEVTYVAEYRRRSWGLSLHGDGDADMEMGIRIGINGL